MTTLPSNRSTRPQNRWIAALVPALDGLRMYPRTAATIALLVGTALAVTLPIAWLTLWDGGHPGTALQLESLAPTGDGGPNYSPASSIQHTALLSFFQMLGAIGIATLVVALLAAFGLAASRASQRSGETTIRRAVGAGRRVLYAGLLAEGTLLAGIVVVVALGGALLLGRTALVDWPDGTASGALPVPLVAVLATSLVLILGLLLPVAFARRQALGEPTTRPVPLLLPTVQLGLSLVALVAGGLLARHATHLLDTPGATPNDGEVYQITPATSSRSSLSGSYADLLSRISSHAGVSLASPGAVIGAGPTNRITTDCGNCMDGTIPARFKRVTVTQQIVSADSFHALGVGVVAGRTFTSRDTVGSKQVAIVSASLARDYFQYGQPIGRTIRIQEARGLRAEADEWYEVVGIVEDRKSMALGGALQPLRAIYLSVTQQPPRAAELLVRSGDSAPTPEQIGIAISRSFGVDGAVVRRSTAQSLTAREAALMRWFGWRIGLLGAVMLMIAAVGTAALMRSWVISLRPELGLRRAVGATTRQLFRLMLGRALLVGAVGTAFGLWFGPPVWDSLRATIRDIRTSDPELIVVLAAALFLATVAGVLLPAIQATRSTAASLLASSGE